MGGLSTQLAAMPPRHARVLAGLLPQAALHVITGVGHALTYQEPHRLAQEVLRFIDPVS
jgi:pimeloyl-ACP methyl ester carboxylesterase